MRFRILGPLEVLSANGWAAISAAKWRSLLACLLLRQGQLVSTEALIFELWGDNPPDTANNLVSIYVHRLRKVIGDVEGRVLVYRAPGYLLRMSPGDLDIDEFESQVAAGRTALTEGDAERAAALFAGALGLWRGPLLADVPPTALVTTQAESAAELRLGVTELRVAADLECGRAAQVVPELRRLVAEHPLREGLWALLMRALEGAGRRAEALETFAQAQEVISAELGVDPGAEVRQLYLELLAADAAAPAPAPGRSRRSPARKGTPRPGGPKDGTGAPPGSRAGAGPDSAGQRITVADSAAGADAASGAGREPAPGTIAIGTFTEPLTESTAPEADAAVPAAAPLAARPAQLPADIGDFTGRERHVEQLCGLLLTGNAASSPGAVRIAVVNGAAGLGKTTLAVHAAHQLSARFPDGQLYVDLLGSTPQSARPGEVLARFLRDLGVEGDKIPAHDEERAALYRTTLTGRRVLILLDNAKDAAQVRPLLPGSSSCAVLVTTRNRTSDLAVTRFVDLNVLEDDEALELFSRIVGDERAAAEPDATAEVLVACAGLPLAIRICAARLAARRQWPIATLADRLRDQHRRLDEMKTGDLAVRASFQVSYDSLRAVSDGTDPARAFRLLGLWHGTTISLPAAAALLGEARGSVADVLESLVDVNLLESPAPDWYRFHDLLKFYATERAGAEEPAAVRDEAVGRLLRWYLDTSEAAANSVSPSRYRVPRETQAGGHPALTFSASAAALAWYDDERANIVVATRQAASAGLHEVACRMPPALFPLFGRWSNWADCVTAHRVALDSARAAGDRPGEAWVRNQLGFALAKLRDREAFGHLEAAMAYRREAGDTSGEVHTALALGEAHLNLDGPGEAALTSMRRAVEVLRSSGPSPLLGVAVNNLGEVYYRLGDLHSAAEWYEQARDISHEVSGHAEGAAWHNLGRVYRDLGRRADAIAAFEESVGKHRAFRVLIGEATALKDLGALNAEIGDADKAVTSLAAAHKLFEQIGDRVAAAETAALLAPLMYARGKQESVP
jgi:DNA-binding SARP family transcriptional activator/TPR repeat protein